jgi:hypothetical protein
VTKWKAGENLGKILMLLGAILALISLCSCSQEQGNVAIRRIDMEVEASKFTVEYCGNFTASQADRASCRSIYVVTDTQTGIKYLAIEGCGTAQLVKSGNETVEQ